VKARTATKRELLRDLQEREPGDSRALHAEMKAWKENQLLQKKGGKKTELYKSTAKDSGEVPGKGKPPKQRPRR